MKILIVGHACAPGLGSEPGNTWNYAWHMSRIHQVWVIAYPEFKDRVDTFLASHPNENIQFVWVVPKSRLDSWEPGTNQEKGVRFHYWLWMKAAYAEAARLYQRVGFELVHHVSLSTIAVPPLFWKLPVPAIWGPVGGGQSFPKQFTSYLGNKRTKEFLRSLNLALLPYSWTLRRALAGNTTALATNFETRDLFQRSGAKKVGMFLDCAAQSSLNPVARQTAGKPLTLLWAGRFEPQKGLSLAVRAMAQCKHPDVRLLVAGSGSEQEQMESLSQSLGLTERVKFLGRVPRETMETLFQTSDALVFTSLRDSFGSVVLEALAAALPVVALDHQGIRAFVPDEACMKVAVSSPQQTIANLAHAFDVLAANPDMVPAMSRAAIAFAANQTWEHRVKAMNELYVDAVNDVKADKPLRQHSTLKRESVPGDTNRGLPSSRMPAANLEHQ
jgi:glycosyltransferase involved in cell wall biosynthesis